MYLYSTTQDYLRDKKQGSQKHNLAYFRTNDDVNDRAEPLRTMTFEIFTFR